MLRYLFVIVCVVWATAGAQDSGPNRIGVRVVDGQGEFYDIVTGDRFVPRGVNYLDWTMLTANSVLSSRLFDTALFDGERIRRDFRLLADHGYNTVRIFIDQCSNGPTCIGSVRGRGLNPDYIANIAAVIQIAADEGIYLLLTSNDLPDAGGYWDISARGESEQFAGYRNAHYLTEPGVESARTYWRDVLTMLAEHEPPDEALLAWSILNEQWFFGRQPPLSLRSGLVTTANGQTYDMSDAGQRRAMAVDGTVHYMNAVSEVIREHAPETLVTSGFFAPKYPNQTETGGDWVVHTAELMERTALDFFDFHAYPGGDLTATQFAENFGMGAHPEKPVIMGEVGVFRDRQPSVRRAGILLGDFIAESCAAGFDGWLFWEYFGGPGFIGDATWGMRMADNFLLETFAPVNQPDPCVPGEIELDNVAFEKPVSASSALPNEPAANAVDDTTDSQWGSGRDAPGWIEIDLVTPRAVGRVALTVAQYPAGRTVHRVWAVQSDGRRVLLAELDGPTSDPQVLTIDLPAAVPDVRRIRVETVESPSWVSWREIEVYTGEGEACVVGADGSVNLRAEPSTSAAVAGSLAAGTGAAIDSQTTGADGMRWWRLTHGVWVREDVVTASGGCADVPAAEAP
jgi:hypothetical protein